MFLRKTLFHALKYIEGILEESSEESIFLR
jgi:hypothetical protein